MIMPTKKGRGLIYARPSFLEGMARIFDIGGTLNEYDFSHYRRERAASKNGAKADMEALRSDWQAVGDDNGNGEISDAEAIRSDWQAVGDDMRAVMGDYDVYVIEPEEDAEPAITE